MASQVDRTSVASLARALRDRGVDTSTPGKRGEERRAALERRMALHDGQMGFVPPPPVQSRAKQPRVPPPPREEAPARKIPPPPLRGLAPAARGGPTTSPIKASAGTVASAAPKHMPWHATFGEADVRVQPHVRREQAPAQPAAKPEQEQEQHEQHEQEPIVSKDFECEQCGKSFKKIAHLIVHSRTHKKGASEGRRTSLDSAPERKTARQGPAPAEAALQADKQWLEEFAQGLYALAQAEGLGGAKGGKAGGAPGELVRRNTIPNHGSRGRPEKVPPPPQGPPPPKVLRAASMPNILSSSAKQIVTARQTELQRSRQLEEEIEAVRTECNQMERKKEAALRERLHTHKDVDMQELEWELEQVQSELRRVEEFDGLFIDSRIASKTGRTQRWAKEDLAERLVQMEAAAAHRLRAEIARVRGEEERHPEYGAEAQRKRRERVSSLEAQLSKAKLDARKVRNDPLLRPRALGEAVSAEQIAHEALVMHKRHRRLEDAEKLYRKAIEEGCGSDPSVLGNFALLLSESRARREQEESSEWVATATSPRSPTDDRLRRNEEADACFRRAIRADPSHANNLSNYATFLKNNLRDYGRAEQYFQRACRAAPGSAATLGNYAHFLHKIRAEHARADRMFQRALELEPEHVNNLCNYASLLKKLGREPQAEELYRQALRREPRNATVLSNWANLIAKSTPRHDKSPPALQRLRRAQELYLQALSASPNHRNARRNYMIFLRDFPALRASKNEASLPGEEAPPSLSRGGGPHDSKGKGKGKGKPKWDRPEDRVGPPALTRMIE